MRIDRIGSLLAVAASGLVLAACGSSTDGGGTGTAGAAPAGDGNTTIDAQGPYDAGATFTLALGVKPDSLDPLKSLTDASVTLMHYAYDYLVTVDGDGRLVPGIAESWEERPRQATFTLKDGVTCADGSAVTATTVKRNLDAVKDPKLDAMLLGVVVPNADYRVTADDAARTVTIRMGEPFGLLVPSLQLLPIVCGKGLDDRSLLDQGTSGSGPYVLESAVPGDHYELTRRDGYTWGPDGPTADVDERPATVRVRIVTNPTTAANLMLSGELSAAPLNAADGKRLTQAGIPSARFPSTTAFTFFNQAEGLPGADPAVRRALAMAMPRDPLARVLYNGVGTVADGFLASKMACDDAGTSAAVPSGATAAASVLDDAGWTKGSGGIRAKDGTTLRMRIVYANDVAGADAGVELLSAAWKELGVQPVLKPMAADAAIAAAFGGDWDVLPTFEIGLNLPSQLLPFVSGPAPDRGQNFPHVANARYDELSAQAMAQTGEPGCELWNEADRALAEQADVIPLVRVPMIYFAQEGTGMALNSFGPIPTSIRVGRG